MDAPDSDQCDSTLESSPPPSDEGARSALPVADEVLRADDAESRAAGAADEAPLQADGNHAGQSTSKESSAAADISRLPKYSRSLLKIRVPIRVQLAAKKELVQEVLTMAPGSIIKFEKGCEEQLQMIVGEQQIAEGEAVKIGEKFGFRVTSLLLPREHFLTVKRERSA